MSNADAQRPGSPSKFFIQVAPEPGGALSPQAAADGVVVATPERLQGISQAIRDTSEALTSSLERLARRPDELEIEFGVSIGGEAGIPFVSKGKIDANFTVTVRWSRSDA
jgi:hypothetical protein